VDPPRWNATQHRLICFSLSARPTFILTSLIPPKKGSLMKSAMVSFADLPRVVTAIAALIAGAGALSLGNGATAGIVYNGSPGFSQTGSFFGTYNMLPNPSPNEGGFFLIQNAVQPGPPQPFPPFNPGPDQPTSSRLSSFSDSHFSFAAFDQVVNSSLISPSNTGIDLVNGSYYVAFDVVDQANANAVYYGWMNVTASGINTLSTVTFTLNEWAYDNTGASIRVGQVSAVPEPSTYAMPLAGIACGGYSLVRRRRAR
jgi:hypothetical protein